MNSSVTGTTGIARIVNLQDFSQKVEEFINQKSSK